MTYWTMIRIAIVGYSKERNSPMKEFKSRCFGHPNCVMTAGYSIGGGYYQCWAHTLFSPSWQLFCEQKMVIMPSMEQQHRMAETWTENENDSTRLDHRNERLGIAGNSVLHQKKTGS